MAQNKAVTHCYERPTFPDWPYTHFTMVHATSQEGCEDIGKEIGEATGITDRMFLYSTREYKKTRVRYFVPDYDRYKESQDSAEAYTVILAPESCSLAILPSARAPPPKMTHRLPFKSRKTG